MEFALLQHNSLPGRRCLMLLICLGLQVCHALKHIGKLVDSGAAMWFANSHRILHQGWSAVPEQLLSLNSIGTMLRVSVNKTVPMVYRPSFSPFTVHGRTCLGNLRQRRGSSDLVLSL